MTSGYEANHSGQFLEQILRLELSKRGFLFREHDADSNNFDMFTARIVVTNVPYQSLYGGTSRSEFVIYCEGRTIRCECRQQCATGSVDEKFPYLLRNAIECAPEREVLILYGGDGARPSAIAWLKREAAKVQHKRIHVININEFPTWVRKELLNGFNPIDDAWNGAREAYGVIRNRKASGGRGWEPRG